MTTMAERKTIGSLVKHTPTGGIGLVIKHTMFDAYSGGFLVEFVKPVDNVIDGKVINQLTQMYDRHDAFELVS